MNQLLMKRTLLTNMGFSFACSIALIWFSSQVALFMGQLPATYYLITGILLLLFSLIILYVATRPTISKTFALWAAIADWLWVVATAILLPIFANQFSVQGIATLIAIAITVGSFAALETKALTLKKMTYA